MTPYTANITSTYRLQFHKEFTFSDLEQIQDYLDQLGIGAIYASPVFKSVPGSTHGYDVVDPGTINPEVGTEQQLKSLALQLNQRGIGWLQDIVPNHMGFHPENPWLQDLLEKGGRSVYANFFDTSRYSHFFQGRIMVPFLGASLEEVLEKSELKITFNGQRLVFDYYGAQWPLHPLSYDIILRSCGGREDGFSQLAQSLAGLPETQDAAAYARQWDAFRKQLGKILNTGEAEAQLNRCLEKLNSDTAQLRRIANLQAYRLCSWEETDHTINYRRFFTINGLICLNMQEEAVFRQYHALTGRMLKEGVFNGLRVDHVDGLFDPESYLGNLRELAGPDTYIIVEKILENGEALPRNWPLQGTSGYEFLALVNNLFTWNGGAQAFTRFYRQLTGDQRPPQEQVWEKKASILREHMRGELDNLLQLFRTLITPQDPGPSGNPGQGLAGISPGEAAGAVTDTALREAIAAFLVHCPVYRYYGNRFPLDEAEAAAIRSVLDVARGRLPALRAALGLLEEVLLDRPLAGDQAFNARALLFYQRCMQFSGPLMAKGVEDTLMYTYNRFIGHNEVGDSPEAFGISPDMFHRAMEDRAKNWPHSLNATATHDTKRGEDVRARLNALTNMPLEWIKAVGQWRKMNRGSRQQDAPDSNEEYLIYQTLAGAWPLEERDRQDFGRRLREYMVKALREAKRHSSWSQPNEEYEQSVGDFIAALLDEKRPFRRHFANFIEQVRDPGRINSLAQVLLKFTCPGIPDIYQGCELWDLSLVDPDNRRPVDYEVRKSWLNELSQSPKRPAEMLSELWQDRASARIKLWLTHLLLQERRRCPLLFSEGHYIPLRLTGPYRKHLLAFARRHGAAWYVSVVCMHPAVLCRRQETEVNTINWKDTRLVLPGEAPGEWENVFDGTSGSAGDSSTGSKSMQREILISEIFGTLPLALLKLTPPAGAGERSAGVLMHITSLPSPFGSGDLGRGAREFAEFLSKSAQRYWQLLPLNPVAPQEMYSPYSPVSSMAGNPLLLSPELLAGEGWLDEGDLRDIPGAPAANLDEAFGIRERLLEKAWKNFRRKYRSADEQVFRQFCDKEAGWLHDFALYMVLKKRHSSQPWYKWAEKYRLRDKPALEALAASEEEALDREKWLQFLFSRQWTSLRAYCASLGIEMFGDLPFYISYDSADVWANPEIFSVDRQGRMRAVAGVPPDYFNDNGQLWGMPVFRWDVLKKQGYDWWLRRIRRNMEWFDLLRLDHFRAFSAYWEVPAGEKTAVNGKWKPGPGAALFKALQKELGALPFVAEDLGDIDEDVYRLRDDFCLPGMKVLQFAFGGDVAHSPHIPHQYTPDFIVYTGTHDNNTSRGWYAKELDKHGRRRLRTYASTAVGPGNVHQVLARMAHASVARTVILPLQDLLGLDERARMNIPASVKGNWEWRLRPDELSPAAAHQLLKLTRLYGRG